MRFHLAGGITAGLALLALPVLAQDAPPPPIPLSSLLRPPWVPSGVAWPSRQPPPKN